MKFQTVLFCFLFLTNTAFGQNLINTPTSMEEIQPWVENKLLNTPTKVLDSIIGKPLDDLSLVLSRQIYNYDPLARQTLYQLESYSRQDPSMIQVGSQRMTEYGDQIEIETNLDWMYGWQLDDRQTDSLDANGLIQARLRESWNEMTMAFEAFEWLVYNYRSGTDLVEERLTYRWENGAWERYRRNIFTYDAQDNLTLETLYSPLGTDDWMEILRSEKEYDALGNLILDMTYTWDEIEMDFFLNRTWYYWYGGDELLDSVQYNTTTVTGPTPFGFSAAYTYEGELLKNFTTYSWDSSIDVYTANQYIEYTHDADGDISQVRSNLFDAGTGQAMFFTLSDHYYSLINVATQEVSKAPAFVCRTANPHTPGQAINCQTEPDQVAPTAASVYDLQGRLHWSQQLAPQNGSWDIYLNTELPSGLYFLVWESPQGILGQQKLWIP